MKNTEYKDLKNVVVPVELRLECYKKALIYYKRAGDDPNYGLCMKLPMILFGVQSWDEVKENTLVRSYQETELAFPELTVLLESAFPNGIEWTDRIEFLKTTIKTLESEL